MFVYFTLQGNGSYNASFYFIEFSFCDLSYAGWMHNLKRRKLFLSKRKFCLGEVIKGQVSPNITVKEKPCNLRFQPVSHLVSGNMSVGVGQYFSLCQTVAQSMKPTCQSLAASISFDAKLSTGSNGLPSQNSRLFSKRFPLRTGQKY